MPPQRPASPGQHMVPSGDGYFPVPVDVLDTAELELDLYLVHAAPGRGAPPKRVLYRSVGSPYSVTDCAKLADQGVTHLHVPIPQHRVFQRLMTRRVVEAYEDPKMPREQRVRVVRSSCGRMIDDLMHFPNIPGIGRTVGEMAGRFAAWCIQDEGRFCELLDLTGADLRAVEHMMNVGIGCGLLGAELLGRDPGVLRGLVQGGLLHDVGKGTLPAGLDTKEGRLSAEEWAFFRAHADAGVSVLTLQEGVASVALDMARHHHERPDGMGYPDGVKSASIPLSARICAVVDVFSTLSSRVPGRPPSSPNRVLDAMRSETGMMIDRGVFEAWERVLERTLRHHGGLTVPDRGEPAPSLRSVLPSEPKQAGVRPAASGGEDGTHAPSLRSCDLEVTISLPARRGVPGEYPARLTGVGQSTAVLSVDFDLAAGEPVRLRLAPDVTRDLIVQRRQVGPKGEWIVWCQTPPARKAG